MKWLSILHLKIPNIDSQFFVFVFINQIIKCTKFYFFFASFSFCFLFFPFACCKFLLNPQKKNPKSNQKPSNPLCVGNPACTQNHWNPTLKSTNKTNKNHRSWPDQFNTFGTKRRRPEQQQQRLEWHPGRAAWESAPWASTATTTGACSREACLGSPVHQPGYRTYVAHLCVT